MPSAIASNGLSGVIRRAALATAGREWVRRERTWEANGPRYRAAYEAILGPLG